MAFGTTGYIQFGTSSNDIAYDITTDSSGNLYVTGSTGGSFPSNSNLGGSDAFIAKYDATGTQLWVKQFGSSSSDLAYDISTDSSGNLYVTGVTSGSLPGYTNSGLNDAFIAKYDVSGTQLWTKQFGSSSYDTAYGVSTDSSGNVYVTGYANGIFVAKYNASGTQVWTYQFGASNDSARGISIDNSSIYVTGQTSASLPGNNNLGNADAFVARDTFNGIGGWVKQFGTSSYDDATAISTDGNGNVYVTGWTQGSLPGNSKLGLDDAFVAKYDASGNQLWIKQFGSSNNDHAEAISTDSGGNIYIAGYNDFDPFLTKFNANGTQLWVKSFTSFRPGGYPSSPYPSTNYGISTDSNGNVYITSYTSGSLLGNSNLGGSDAFIAGFDGEGNLLAPYFSINDVTITEGDSGTKNATFTVTRTGIATNPITIDYATANGTATAGIDYTATNGTLTFATNETTKTINVPIIGDTVGESNETFFVNLTNATNAIFTDAQGSGTITNDDIGVTLAIYPVSVSENSRNRLTYTFTRTGVLTNSLTVNFNVAGTATLNTDYIALNPNIPIDAANFNSTTGTVTFAANSETATIMISPIADTTIEPDETIALTLATGTGYTVSTTTPVTGIIVNDDWSPGTTGYIQFGTSSDDSAYGVSTDSSGNIYVTGYTYGSFPGNNNLGNNDAFVAKYDANGTQFWVKQFGSSSYDTAYGISTDSSGNIYVIGDTYGSLPGNSNLGYRDAFLTKYDASGNQVWSKQFGSSNMDSAHAISIDSSGNIYVAGDTSGGLPGNSNLGNNDAFLTKYDASGNQVWIKQFGSSGYDYGNGVTIDNSGNIYVTSGAFIAKYNASGDQVWSKQLGSSRNGNAHGITIDNSGNIYVTGVTSDVPNGFYLGNNDALVAKYDASGNQVWIKYFGSSDYDSGDGITIDNSGNVYITGVTYGNLPNNNTFGYRDAFLTKYDASGNQVWIKQFGSSGYDYGNGITIDNNGNVYVTGLAADRLPVNSYSGYYGAFLVGFDSNGNLVNTANTSSTLSINDVTLTEGNSGTKNATFTVTLSNPVNSIVSVNYATANNTATAGSDYLATNGTLTFNANETTKTITVQVNGDNQVELNESFFLNLSNLQTNGSNVTLADNQGQATITNDDTATISINDVTVIEGNNNTTNAVFTVNLSNQIDTAITLNYATANGTATTSDNDYLAINSTPLTFNAGETSKTITVQINGDTKAENNENFFVNLSNLQTNSRNVTLGDNQGQATITNDDINNIIGTLGKDNLTGTSQDDIIIGLQGADILIGNGGKDQFIYQNIRDTGDIIKDFEIGQDKIVLTALLNSLNYKGSNPITDSYVKFGARGNDSIILIDEDGIGSKRALPFITVENTAITAMQNPSNFVF